MRINLQETNESFPWDMNSSSSPWPEKKKTHGGDATGKTLDEETVVHGAVRSSGESSPVRRGRKGEIAAAAVAQMEFLKQEVRGGRRGTPAPLFIAPSGNGRTTARFSERRTVTAPWNSVATSVAVCSKHMYGHRIGDRKSVV